MDNIELNKKIILRPIKTERATAKSITSTQKVDKKSWAQILYYKNHDRNKVNKLPVQMRLGNRITRHYRYQNFSSGEYFVKPRIKKCKNELMTVKYQKTQQHLIYLRKRNRLNPQNFIIVANANKKVKYPQLFHSLRGSINQDLKIEIDILMRNCIRSDDIDNDMPFHTEDTTALSLHQRFSSYP